METAKEVFIVCDYYHENADINIDAICDTHKNAVSKMKEDIGDFVEHYGYTLNEDMSLSGPNIEGIYINTDGKNYATFYVDNIVVCDWFVKKAKLPN